MRANAGVRYYVGAISISWHELRIHRSRSKRAITAIHKVALAFRELDPLYEQVPEKTLYFSTMTALFGIVGFVNDLVLCAQIFFRRARVMRENAN